MIYEGWVEEGLAIVKGVRDRHDGTRRNPWNEFECGNHYARSMASYAVMTALSGFAFDAPNRCLGFDPKVSGDDFACFFSTGTGWGLYRQTGESASLEVRYGTVALSELHTPAAAGGRVELEGHSVGASVQDGIVRLAEPITLRAGQTLRVIR
jgi:hypothetical protein